MRPYLAILKDCFREAISSRVLTVLLLLITFLLIALFPLNVIEKPGTGTIDFLEVSNWSSLANDIQSANLNAGPNPSKQLLSKLDTPAKSALEDLTTGEPSPRKVQQVITGLKQVLKQRDFYDADSWRSHMASPELLNLLKQDQEELTSEEVQRRNRLLLESAYPRNIQMSPPTTFTFTYIVELDLFTFPLSRQQIHILLKEWLKVFLGYVLGAIGIFVAILVTSSMIPNTFESGAIDLLSSKPISRSLLFISKFFGACAFIFILVSYAMLGMWLLLGIRWQFWEPNMLLAIPVFLFVFAIYYSVSALSGLIWKNAIISVVLTVLFFVFCWCLSMSNFVAKTAIEMGFRYQGITTDGTEVFAVDEKADNYIWSPVKNNWEQFLQAQQKAEVPFGVEGRQLSLKYDAANERLVTIVLPSMGGPRVPELVIAKASTDWERETVAQVPSAIIDFAITQSGDILILTPHGPYLYAPQDKHTSEPVTLFGFKLPIDKQKSDFLPLKVTPGQVWLSPLRVAVHPESGNLAVWSAGKLLVFEYEKDKGYTQQAKADFEQSDLSAVLGYAGNHIIAATSKGDVFVFNAKTLKTELKFQPDGNNEPRFVEVSPDGNWFGVVFHTGKLWVYDAKSARGYTPTLWAQGSISAIDFSKQNRLLVSYDGTRVNEYDLATWSITKSIVPKSNMFENLYRYGIRPLYTILPKPNEYGYLTDYFLTGKKTVPTAMVYDLQAKQIKQDFSSFLWSGFGFIVFMLTVSCLYLRRAEF